MAIWYLNYIVEQEKNMRLSEIIEGRIEDTFGTKSIDKHDRPEKKKKEKPVREGDERSIIADRLVDDVEREFSDAKGQIKDHNRDTYEMNMYNYMSRVRVDDIVDPDMIHGGQRMGDFASGRVIDVIDPSSIIDRVIERLS